MFLNLRLIEEYFHRITSNYCTVNFWFIFWCTFFSLYFQLKWDDTFLVSYSFVTLRNIEESSWEHGENHCSIHLASSWCFSYTLANLKLSGPSIHESEESLSAQFSFDSRSPRIQHSGLDLGITAMLLKGVSQKILFLSPGLKIRENLL